MSRGKSVSDVVRIAGVDKSQSHFRTCFNRVSMACLVLFGLSSCMLFKLQENLEQMEKLTKIKGSLIEIPRGSKTIAALVRNDVSPPKIVNYKIFSEGTDYAFSVMPGSYQVFAYQDTNDDFRYQRNEPAAQTITLIGKPGETIQFSALEIPKRADPELARVLDELKRVGVRALPKCREDLGKVISLDHDAFSLENRKAGMWEPLRFAKEIPFGIFFLQDFKRDRIPVLFVHGIGGSPREFEHAVKQLDSSRFQPWVAYYPSGLRLETVTAFLSSSLDELKARFEFTRMIVVAHSMGGLVSRALILENAERKDGGFVDALITLSTPWAGHAAAASGVKSAPVVMPVWIDMAPGSEFIHGLFAQELKTPHYLLFGFHGGRGVFQDSNNDGVVTLASQLRPEAQMKAQLVRGFDADHMGILKHQGALETLHEVLRLVENRDT